MPKFIIKITADDKTLLDNDDVCCYLADETSAPAVLAKADASDKLVLASGDNAVDFCLKAGLDGVLTSDPVDEKFPGLVKRLHKKIGKKFWGAACGITRHEAMIASEAEPDFVAFRSAGRDGEADILDWYAELFLLQSALFYTPEINEKLLSKTDFLIINTSEYKILVDKIKRLD